MSFNYFGFTTRIKGTDVDQIMFREPVWKEQKNKVKEIGMDQIIYRESIRKDWKI